MFDWTQLVARTWNQAGVAFGAVFGWLLVQNSFLLVQDPHHWSVAPFVVARALARVVMVIAGHYPFTTLLLIMNAALAVLLGLATWKNASPEDGDEES